MVTKSLLLGVAVAALAATPRFATAQARPDCAAMPAPADHATMDHEAHMKMMAACAPATPASPGQAAFGTIREVVSLLDADPTTDWSKVNVEALRQHLIDMDDVVMHAVVAQRNVPGGVEMTVTGSGRTVGAIQRMTVNHTHMLDQGADYHASARPTRTGATLTITTKHDGDERAVARIRGLGFAGLLTEGDHHSAHHLAIARGDAMPHGR